METPEQSCPSFSDIMEISEEFLFNPNEDDDDIDFIISDIIQINNNDNETEESNKRDDDDNHNESGQTITNDNGKDDEGDDNQLDNDVNNNIVDQKQNNNDIGGRNDSYNGHKRTVKSRKTIRKRQKRDLRHKLDANIIQEVCHWQRNYFKITKKPAPLWTGNCPKQAYIQQLIDKIILNAIYRL